MDMTAININGVGVCGTYVVTSRTRALGWFMPAADLTSPTAMKHKSPGSARRSPDST